MGVQAGDGKEYKVTFVHSAHDLKHRRPFVPGSLRHIADDLASSFRRRVTVCQVSEEENGVYTPVAFGFAKCHYIDQFNKAEGRKIALFRALRSSKLLPDVRDEVAWHAEGESYEGLKATIQHQPGF